ncbi:hypothetical protein ACHAXR_009845 [Thalassiosira sp. AJA248-18]
MNYGRRPTRNILSLITCSIQIIGGSGLSSGYSELKLQRLAQASSLSYISMDKMASSPYYKTCKLEPITQVIDQESESGATIFRADENNNSKLVVACRGSANTKNFGTNLKFNLVPATRLSQITPEDAMVHEGFQAASLGLWKELSPKLMEHIDLTSTSEVEFTGHSLGAATALLCATHYNASFKEGPLPSIVTFGGPKLCNSVLAQHLRNDALEGCNILHLVHSKDPVLANNQKLWDSLGFENVGIELECDPHSSTVYDAEESVPKKKTSLFGNFAWNIVDHCKYMGVFVGPRAFS